MLNVIAFGGKHDAIFQPSDIFLIKLAKTRKNKEKHQTLGFP